MNSTLVILIVSGLILLTWMFLNSKLFVKNKRRLINLLDKSEEMASRYSNQNPSTQKFHNNLKSAILEYKNGDDSALDKFWVWFAPTSLWDDYIGKEGENLANEIFDIVTHLRKK